MGRSDCSCHGLIPGLASIYEFSAITIKKRSIALFLMRLPVFVPIHIHDTPLG